MSTLNTNPGYSDDFEDKPLPLKLYSEHDDEEDLPIKKKLEALVNGDTSPSQTAIDFDTAITEVTNQKQKEVMKRPDQQALTPEERAQGINMYDLVPNPRLAIHTIFLSLARLCSAFPPYHPGQNRIVEFLEALRGLPRHEAYTGCPSEDPNEPYPTVLLWPLGGDWEGVAVLFDYEITCMFTHTPGVNSGVYTYPSQFPRG